MARILNREERAALLQKHILDLRKGEAEVEKARVPFKAAQDAQTSRFNTAKADLGKRYTRKYLQGLVDDFGAKTRDLAALEVQRFEDRTDLSLPTFGEQRDMFGSAASDTERDAIAADIDGYRAGRRADDPTVPAEFSAFASQWMAGWHKGQEENGKLLQKAAELATVEEEEEEDSQTDQAEDDDGEELTEAAVQAVVKSLKKSGFLERRQAAEATH